MSESDKKITHVDSEPVGRTSPILDESDVKEKRPDESESSEEALGLNGCYWAGEYYAPGAVLCSAGREIWCRGHYQHEGSWIRTVYPC